jgi:hypothetical protein
VKPEPAGGDGALDPSAKLSAVAASREKGRVDLLDKDAAVLYRL